MDATFVQFDSSRARKIPPPGDIFVVCNCTSYRYMDHLILYSYDLASAVMSIKSRKTQRIFSATLWTPCFKENPQKNIATRAALLAHICTNPLSAGASPQTPPKELTALPQTYPQRGGMDATCVQFDSSGENSPSRRHIRCV